MTQPSDSDSSVEDIIRWDIDHLVNTSSRSRIFSQLVSTALGSIPWVGGFISGAASFKANEKQLKSNKLFVEWMNEHTKKIAQLRETLFKICKRLDEFPNDINDRLESEEYLQIVRKSFRTWDNSDTFEKKEFVRKLLTNAGAQKIVPDDLIRLFLDWLTRYHEVHFAVIKNIYQNQGATRSQIWRELNGANVREDSMEADVFKVLIRDLSTGGVIRQQRLSDSAGNFYKKQVVRHLPKSNTLKSAFDDGDRYELTELGKQFVHYTMSEVVSQIKE